MKTRPHMLTSQMSVNLQSAKGFLNATSANPEAVTGARPVLAAASHILHSNVEAVAGIRQLLSSSLAEQQPSGHQHSQQPSDYYHGGPQQHALQQPGHHGSSQLPCLQPVSQQAQGVPRLCPHCFDFLSSDHTCCPAAAAAHRANRHAGVSQSVLHHRDTIQQALSPHPPSSCSLVQVPS